MGESEKKISESDICDPFISPSIRAAGWYPMTQIRRALTLARGPVVFRRNKSSHNKKEITDYVLSRESSVPLARQPQGQKNILLCREAVLTNTPAQHILQETR